MGKGGKGKGGKGGLMGKLDQAQGMMADAQAQVPASMPGTSSRGARPRGRGSRPPRRR